MIQRIQSLYVSVVVFLSSMLLFGNIVSFPGPDGAELELRYNGLFILSDTWDKAESLLPLTILLLTVPVIAFITFFLFKFRKLQLRAAVLTLLLLVGEVLLTSWYLFYVATKYDASVIFNIKITFPVVSAILMYLAFRGILKDELLVRSYDRLR